MGSEMCIRDSIIADGKIVKSGDYSLALELEEKGYEEISQTA